MQAERQARPLALALRLRRSSVGGCRHTVVNRPGRPPERCSKLGVCGVGVGAGHACRSRDSLRLLTPSDGRGKRHPSTCTEDEDDAPASSRVEDDEAPPSPSVASSDGGLNQFAKMRLIERARGPPAGARAPAPANTARLAIRLIRAHVRFCPPQRSPAKPQKRQRAKESQEVPSWLERARWITLHPSCAPRRPGPRPPCVRAHCSYQLIVRPPSALLSKLVGVVPTTSTMVCAHTVVGYRRVRVHMCMWSLRH